MTVKLTNITLTNEVQMESKEEAENIKNMLAGYGIKVALVVEESKAPQK